VITAKAAGPRSSAAFVMVSASKRGLGKRLRTITQLFGDMIP
jgi:hypothetical protein